MTSPSATAVRDDPTAGPPALEARHVGHRFGARQALADVSLIVPRGRLVALLGPNGAGKTTFFAVLTRLYDNRAGSVRVFGHDLRRTPSAALAEMGVVFQSRTLDADLTVRQNLGYHAALHGGGGFPSDRGNRRRRQARSSAAAPPGPAAADGLGTGSTYE